MIDATVIKGFLDAGTIVICLAAVLVLWRELKAEKEAHLLDLREELKTWRELAKSQPPYPPMTTVTASAN